MSITFSGLATGLKTDDIVDAIMAVERAPLDRIEAQKAADSERLKAFAQFKTELDDLKSAVSSLTITSQVRSSRVSLGSDEAFSATTSSGALGSYAVSVTQLSQVQKTISDGFSSNSDSILGTGTITVNGTDISVTEDNDSLIALVQAINEQSETTGVTASIINDGSDTNPYHLVFTGKDANTTFSISSNLVDGSSDPIPINTTNAQTAQQAVLFIDGIKVVSDTNTISDSIRGVTIKLDELSTTSSAGTSEIGVDPWDWAAPPVYVTDQLRIEADTGILKEKVTTFVSSFNKAIEWILSGYDELGGSGVSIAEDGSEEELLGTIT